MKNAIMLILMGLICSCSSLQKQNSQMLKERTAALQQEEQLLTQVQTAQIKLDSSELVTELIFWPKGVMKYTASGGFEGEAHQIILKSKTKQQQVWQASAQLTTLNHKSLVQQQQELLKAKKAAKAKKPSYFGLMIWIILGCLIVAAVYFVYKRKFFR